MSARGYEGINRRRRQDEPRGDEDENKGGKGRDGRELALRAEGTRCTQGEPSQVSRHREEAREGRARGGNEPRDKSAGRRTWPPGEDLRAGPAQPRGEADEERERESFVDDDGTTPQVEVLSEGEGVKALGRFNDALEGLAGRKDWDRALEPVWAEMAYNLESFNPVFTACMLKVQCTIGSSE